MRDDGGRDDGARDDGARDDGARDDGARDARTALARVRTPEDALALFDALPAVEVDDVLGSWCGATVGTGHPLDGLLELYGWHGKRFDSADVVHPLVFADARGRFAVDPALVPLRLLVRLSGPLHDERVAGVLRGARRLRATRRPRARLRTVRHRGVETATMTYDALAVDDHFRALGDDALLGVMDARGLDRPFVFSLHRESGGAPQD
ncbi:GXWXG domain-containing protein [uncultured Pseudokineococcus sp.]|uniref:GXWXG domain-containing protein n=1 Tax=uncultured Pseudokineococcus sp. TaxID=1642928 RepID=UPI00263043FB|nr:GXWXG domain-containing protein [uncultured Pseudokineococcus sp.]